VTAVVEPSNAFTVDKVTDHPRKGSATLTADLPGPGVLAIAGKGVKARGSGSVTAVAPGNVSVLVRPTGRTKAKLGRSGRAKVSVKLTYTPTGGDSASSTKAVKLRQR
jgi:hypothetical protein